MSAEASLERLRRARVEEGVVLALGHFGELIELTVSLPWLASTVRPGEFAQLRCGTGPIPLLRRPFSVAWAEGDACSFIFEPVGQGTSLLARLRPGDGISVLGPLGTGFTVEDVAGPVLCLSGGVGCAPFPLLIKHLLERDVADITVINGSSSATRLYPAERFGRGAVSVRVLSYTEDGTEGTRGLVTDALDATPRTLLACGPNPMLAAIAARVAAHPRGSAVTMSEASTEASMGCGFGTCLGCAMPVHEEGTVRWKLCCTDGPVFPLHSVVWNEVQNQSGVSAA